MSKFKETPGGNAAYRSFTGNMRVLSQEDDFLFKVELWELSDEVNRNNWKYLNLEKHAPLFADTPILVAYVNGGTKVGDGHNFSTKIDKHGEEYASFVGSDSERIVGWISGKDNVRIEKKDGLEWIVATGSIWTWYSRELTAMLKERGSAGMDVSIETLIDKMHMDGETEVYESYRILGTTILGKGVNPAVAGAQIRTLSLGDDLKEFKLRVAAYQNQAANETEKKGMKKDMALNKAQLEALRKQLSNYTIVGYSADGMNLALLSKEDGCLYGYTRNAEDGEAIIEARIKPLALSSKAKVDSGEEFDVDILGANEAREKELAEAKEAKERAEAEAKKSKEDKEALEKKENARRRNSVKTAIKDVISKYNETAEEEMDEKSCEDILKDAEEDKYTEMEDEKGEFCGDEKACQVVKARIFDREKALRDRKNAEKSKVHSWLDGLKDNSHETQDGIPGLLARINK